MKRLEWNLTWTHILARLTTFEVKTKAVCDAFVGSVMLLDVVTTIPCVGGHTGLRFAPYTHTWCGSFQQSTLLRTSPDRAERGFASDSQPRSRAGQYVGAQVHDVSQNKAKRALLHNRTSKAATSTRSSPTKCGHRPADSMAFPAQGCPTQRSKLEWNAKTQACPSNQVTIALGVGCLRYGHRPIQRSRQEILAGRRSQTASQCPGVPRFATIAKNQINACPL